MSDSSGSEPMAGHAPLLRTSSDSSGSESAGEMAWPFEPSQRCTTLFLGLAAAAVLLTFGVCYAMWVGHGCVAFMPYISDLGLHGDMVQPFRCGLLAAAALMLVPISHVAVARERLLSSLPVDERWRSLNLVVGLAGCAVALGMALLGFFPWDRGLFWHLVCANLVFVGGFTWVLGGWVMARRYASASGGVFAKYTWGPCSGRRRLQLPVVAACACALLLADVCFLGALLSDPATFTWSGISETLRLAHTDFDGYCSAQVGWHGLIGVNLAALCEWAYILLLGVGAALSCVDVEADSLVQQNLPHIGQVDADEDCRWWHFW